MLYAAAEMLLILMLPLQADSVHRQPQIVKTMKIYIKIMRNNLKK
jgi:hypothetical protein